MPRWDNTSNSGIGGQGLDCENWNPGCYWAVESQASESVNPSESDCPLKARE